MHKKINSVTTFIFVVAFIVSIWGGACEAEERPALGFERPTITSQAPSEEPLKGPELERWYFSQWHEPFGAELEADHLESIWSEVKNVPSEDVGRAVNSWEIVGPFGMVNSSGGKYSGRVLDFSTKTSPISLASASGGLWTYVIIIVIPIPVPLSDDLTSLAAGSFDVHPSDDDTIILGTGEPWVRSGTGLYKTTNGGTTWDKLPLPNNETSFYKVRYSPDGNTIHVAAQLYGYYRSTDGGASWTNTLGAGWYKGVSDFAINPSNPAVMYATVWDWFGNDGGLWKSTNTGVSWSKLTSGLPTEPTFGIGRGAVAVSANGTYVYVAFGDQQPPANGTLASGLLGVYKSTNSGSTFTNVSPSDNYLGGQGWYDNVITVSPLNANIALAGGVGLRRTTNGGSSWSTVSDGNLHADYHRFTWTSSGDRLYASQDGGWAYSSDGGATWASDGNLQPITQYVNIDVSSDGAVMGGGSQDNGLSLSNNSGTNWSHSLGGDGGGFAIHPSDNATIYATNGVYGGDWTFRRLYTPDSGATWNHINNGVDPSGQWYNRIRTDKFSPPWLYNNSGTGTTHFVYQSTDRTNWTQLNANNPFTKGISELTVSEYISGGSTVWACLSDTTAGNRLRVADAGSGAATWYTNRDTGLPAGVRVRKVAVHPNSRDVAYALMNGLGNPGQKVYRTTNRGQSWTNITGNLPDVTMADLVPHPTDSNQLYLGTEFGMYRTRDGGLTWERWNNGMPDANIITELAYVDLTGSGGEFVLYAGTYGRGMWKRDISGTDAVIFADGFESGDLTPWN